VSSPAELLRLYDERLRGESENDAGATMETDGPLVRLRFGQGGYVSYRSLDGLSSAELDDLITRQVAHFRALDEQFEWKTRGHDQPADLTQRLLAAGFVPEESETVLVGAVAELAVPPVLPEGVVLREVRDGVDLHRIADLESAVWGEDRSHLVANLAERLANAAQHTMILVAEAHGAGSGEVVSAGWLVLVPGTEFGGLWGGSTSAPWRGRGIYRALVARRAQLALQRNVRYLQVDASEASRPILERLGFVAITTTTPYIWTPPAPQPPSTLGG
jgi:GNAT superfamily N-acetyltransferase